MNIRPETRNDIEIARRNAAAWNAVAAFLSEAESVYSLYVDAQSLWGTFAADREDATLARRAETLSDIAMDRHEDIVDLYRSQFERYGVVFARPVEAAMRETTDLDKVQRLVTQPPDWAGGLPIDGEGFVSARYRKG